MYSMRGRNFLISFWRIFVGYVLGLRRWQVSGDSGQ
jgi:hypothetical protein